MRIIVVRGWKETALELVKVALGLAAVGAALTVAYSLPDLARYLKMRRM